MATKNGEPDTTHSVADDNYENTFGASAKSLRSQEAEAVNGNSSPADIRSRESAANASWTTKTTAKHQRKTPMRLKLKGNMRHKSAFVFILLTLVMGIWYSSVLAPNIILVNIKDLFTNDLADATTALSKYSVKMIDYKIGKADKHCSEPDTIPCKLATMSRNQVLEFKKHGFQINGQKLTEDNLDDNNSANDKPESRWKVRSIVFPDGGGVAMDGASYARIAASSDKMLTHANNVWNPKSSFFMDERYKQRIKTQFDLTKDITVQGQSEKAVDESFDVSMKGENETIDKTGQGAYGLKTLAKDQSGLTQNAITIATAPNSYINAQCAFYTQGKVTYNSAQKAKEVTLARFAMQYLKAADQIKAGQADEVTANTLSGKLAWSSDGGYNGANATDSAMYRHIVMREGVKSSKHGMKYYANAFDSIGALAVASVNTLATAAATKAISGAPGMLATPPADIASQPREYCLEGQTTSSKSSLKPSQCPALTMAAGAAPAFAPLLPALGGIAALSDRTCPMPPKGVWKMQPTAKATSVAVMPSVAAIFNIAVGAWANTTSQDFTSKTKGVAASDAIFAGTGIILGDMAMSRGMQPANLATLPTYLAQQDEFNKEYERIARYEARSNPFDIYNSYSFVGSFIRSFTIATPKTNSIAAILGNVLSIVPSSVSQATSTASAIYNLQPSKLDPSRLTCPDAEYLSIGINADKACNVRYSMGDWEMKADINKVIDYMLKSHTNEYQDVIQDLQQRLSRTDGEGDAADVSRQLSEVREASSKPFIDKKTGDATEFSEYQKYLDYCVNRQDPWGRSGMVVHRKEISNEEKEERYLGKDKDGNQLGNEHTGDIYETRIGSSYMSVTEGAKGDQDWYTGKKCLEDSEMLRNFRAFTMACSVDGSFAGAIDCTEADRSGGHTDDFYTSNDIHYVSWY